MKKIIPILVIGFLAINASQAQTIPKTNQILVRTYEVWTSIYPSEIIISYGEGRTERIELENLKQKNWEANVDKINSVIYNIRKSGFKLKSTNAGGGDGVFISSYLFMKE